MKKFTLFRILFSVVILTLIPVGVSFAKNPNVAPSVSIRSPRDHEVTTGNILDYWNFDEGSGQIVHDLTSYGNNGQLGSISGMNANAPTWVVSDRLISPVPEPSTMLLLSFGLMGAGFFRRKRAKK